MATVIHGPRQNRRVTCDTDPHNARSESALVSNPLNPYHMVGSSKRFTDPASYAFSLAAYATFDGGLTWTETILPLTDTNGTTYPSTTDPAVAFDEVGNVYIAALAWDGEPSGTTLGISMYKSSDGGRTWPAPVFIHAGSGDDKQWAAGDTTPSSPFKGHIYVVWDDTSTGQMLFARTTDHGATWKSIGAQPAGTAIPGIFDSFSPEVNVAEDGTVYIVWVNGEQSGNSIKYVKSTDGGNSFSAPAIAATGITNLGTTLPNTNGWPHFSTATFRVLTIATGCNTGNHLVFAWADTREGHSRIYYRHSPNGGTSWDGPASGQPMLTGELASASGFDDFHAQLMATPGGQVGCAFYEYGPFSEGEFTFNKIVVVLAVSTDHGATFTNRATVSDQPWDPAIDAPFADGDPPVTFIGEYFGLASSSLGFFPFWTDTRTGVQEMFIARVSVYPADLYMRDGPSDVGDVPSPDAVFWESPDMVVRHQPDGDTTFVDQGLLRDGVTDNYVYGRAANRGPNDAPAATFAVTVGNFPSLLGLPGSEFWYPQDWYRDDWNSAALVNNHLFLGESAPAAIPNGSTAILGPVIWPAAQIPVQGTWHPCLLGEVRCGNDDAAGGGFEGADIPADPTATCPHGSFVYGNNNVCQRNLTYAPVKKHAEQRISLPFIAGSVWDNQPRFIEITVDKGRQLAQVPMTLRMEPIGLPGEGGTGGGGEPEPCPCEPGEIVFTGNCRVIVRVGKCEAGEIITTPGTVWRAYCPEKKRAEKLAPPLATGKGQEAKKAGTTWQLAQPRSTVGFTVAAGELRKLTLSFTTPRSLHENAFVRISEKKNGKFVTGGVSLELQVT